MKYEIEREPANCGTCKQWSPTFAKVNIDDARIVINLPCGHQYLPTQSTVRYTITPEQLAILLLASE